HAEITRPAGTTAIQKQKQLFCVRAITWLHMEAVGRAGGAGCFAAGFDGRPVALRCACIRSGKREADGDGGKCNEKSHSVSPWAASLRAGLCERVYMAVLFAAKVKVFCAFRLSSKGLTRHGGGGHRRNLAHVSAASSRSRRHGTVAVFLHLADVPAG